jgi:hypothetical protein
MGALQKRAYEKSKLKHDVKVKIKFQSWHYYKSPKSKEFQKPVITGFCFLWAFNNYSAPDAFFS